MILGKLAAEENRLKGFSNIHEVEVTLLEFTERLEELKEALSMLRY